MRHILILLAINFILAGCTQQEKLTILNFDVSYEKVFCGRDFSVNVYINNNFDREVENLYIGFETIDILNFKGVKKCGNGKIVNYGCLINKLEPGDESEVTFLLSFPGQYCIPGEVPRANPKLIISYDFDGQTKVNIPIYGEGRKSKKDTTVDMTEGPIKVDVSVPTQGVDSNQIFFMDVSIFDSGEENIIKKDDLSIKLQNLQVYSEEGETDCDFEINPDNTLSLKKDFPVGVNKKLRCLLKAVEIKKDGFVYGLILIDYKYNYKMSHHLTITPSND